MPGLTASVESFVAAKLHVLPVTSPLLPVFNLAPATLTNFCLRYPVHVLNPECVLTIDSTH